MPTLDLDKSEPVKSGMAGGGLREPYSSTAELFATDRFRERKGKLLLVVHQLVTPTQSLKERPNPLLTQMALVKQNGSQNNRKGNG